MKKNFKSERAVMSNQRVVVPGPPEPPRVPGHMGYPSQRVLDDLHCAFGALFFLEEDGVDVVDLRQGLLRRAEDLGVRWTFDPPSFDRGVQSFLVRSSEAQCRSDYP